MQKKKKKKKEEKKKPFEKKKKKKKKGTIGQPVVGVKKSMKQEHVIETITENEMALIHTCEATAAIDIEGFDVKVKLDTETEANVMPKRVYDHLME